MIMGGGQHAFRQRDASGGGASGVPSAGSGLCHQFAARVLKFGSHPLRSVGPAFSLLLPGLIVFLGFAHVLTDSAAPSHPPTILTFNRDIAPIVFQHCAVCHHEGQVAPFPLLNYRDVKKRATQIAVVTRTRFMPPWKPEPGFGDFVGSRRLSDEDISKIQAWVAEGAPEGDPRDLPPTPSFGEGWFFGKPDLVVQLSRPFPVPADGPDVYRCFTLPLPGNEDKYIGAYQFRPLNPRVIHHAIIVEDRYGAARRLQGDSSDGYPCVGSFGFPVPGYMGLWAPGSIPKRWPEGVGKVARKGSGLVVQVHFHPTGKPEPSNFEVGLYFMPEPPRRTPFDIEAGTISLDIPPGERNYTVRSSTFVDEDVEAIGIVPHAHYLGKEVKATATLPDGSVKPLLWIRDWNFNWQELYRFASPVFLPQGTRIDLEWIYDNSDANPRNPSHPPKRVTWGVEATDEMCELHVEVVKAEPSSRLTPERTTEPGR